ncbi:DUF1273 family protein [Lacrimispora amygdalina]|uniref:DUF1273 family protein n=1 Tax=Lacrimispora amygdalina TaxID=253257 RepID=A0A3E2NA85_9FIRM|nr:SLOG family protein [Clostridium indicum]RFZ77830.1 DUF1273 family protein [Clostridium indicum]
MKGVCITGHRNIPKEKIDYVREQLRWEIGQAIEDGFTLFLCGMADGADLEFGAIVAEEKMEHPHLFLEAAIPYANRLKSKNPLFGQVLAQCNGIKVISKEYNPNCYFARNRYLVQNSQRVIAVFDGRERSGTAQTIRIASAEKRDIRIIDISLPH